VLVLLAGLLEHAIVVKNASGDCGLNTPVCPQSPKRSRHRLGPCRANALRAASTPEPRPTGSSLLAAHWARAALTFMVPRAGVRPRAATATS